MMARDPVKAMADKAAPLVITEELLLSSGVSKFVRKGMAPDSRYKSLLLSKLVNVIMWDGKKVVARKIVYDCLDIIGKKVKDKSPIEVLTQAVDNVKPLVEVKAKRVGGATYQVPREVKPKRQLVLALRWLKDSFRKKKGRQASQRLANEVLDAYNKQGTAMATRENIHKMAEANKAFAYYA